MRYRLTRTRLTRRRLPAYLWIVMLCVAGARPGGAAPKDRLEPAREALRTLQFERAASLLDAAGRSGDAEAQYLLGLMYLNGVGIAADGARGRALLEAAAGHGHGAAAYALAGELARSADAAPEAARHWLEASAQDGYYRAIDALKSGRPLLDRETVGAADPNLLAPWVIDCARRNDAAQLRRIGPASAKVEDPFQRRALTHAAAAGALDAAAALIELGADVSAGDRFATTALMVAAAQPKEAMVELLLKAHADPAAVDAERRTALFYAARADRPASVRLLARAGAALEARDSRGYDALDAAQAVGAQQAAAELRALGVRGTRVAVDPGRQNGRFDPAHPGSLYRGWPPLALAVARNDTAGVQQLLGAGGDAKLKLPQGDSLLQVAADVHAMQSIPLLLAHGADPLAANRAGHSVLWLAVTRGDLPVARALLDAGVAADAHAPRESAPLVTGMRAKRTDAVLLLLGAGADPQAADPQGRTPLMLAASDGAAGLVKALLDRHAQVNAVDRERRTALWFAAAAGSREIVELLLAAGADAKLADARGLTALHAAALQGHPEVLAPLLAAAPLVNARDAAGDTPLLMAAAAGRAEVVKVLLADKPELDVQDAVGDTALIAATRAGHAAICRMLIAGGAYKALRNRAGVSAHDVAAGRGFESIAKEIAG